MEVKGDECQREEDARRDGCVAGTALLLCAKQSENRIIHFPTVESSFVVVVVVLARR